MKRFLFRLAALAAIVCAAGCAIDKLYLEIHDARTAGMDDAATATTAD